MTVEKLHTIFYIYDEPYKGLYEGWALTQKGSNEIAIDVRRFGEKESVDDWAVEQAFLEAVFQQLEEGG